MTERKPEELAGITHLGSQGTKYDMDYNPSVLETFINKHPENDYFVKFNCPEFTSLCPITLDSRKLITRLGDQSLGCCREQFAFQVFLQDVASDVVIQSIQ